MKLNDIKFVDMLPKMMRDDRTVKGLAAAGDYLLGLLLTVGAALPLLPQLDVLDEVYFDALAAAWNLRWYSYSATLDQKRAIIKSAESVYQQLGTPQAVEQVARDYFGSATVEEWWEYSGTPGHFKINIQAQGITGNELDAFGQAVRWVKRLSAVLDSITTEVPVQGALYEAGAYLESETQHLSGGD